MKQLNETLKLYNEKYPLYPILYFYGFGNGILYKALLQNPNLKHIVVFESELEILFIMFHLVDFTKELEEEKILFLNPKKDFFENQLKFIFGNVNDFFYFSRVYFLELHCDFYDKFHEQVVQTNQKIIQTIKNSILAQGNDPLDALQGIEQFVYNLSKMITHPSLLELFKKRKKLYKNAIIVSTGPSLTKQLPLLKKYQDKAVIFCADSAYPILAKENIKPDYVCMVERTKLTAEFFNHDFDKDFDKDTIFLLTSLVHPNAIKYLEKRQRTFMLLNRTLDFQGYLDLRKFGLVEQCVSVAHLAFIIAYVLAFENIIIIGQDLAFADNGDSHPKDYQNSATFESYMYEKFPVQAYGGKGVVQTHLIWEWFKSVFEALILRCNQNCNIYNATEGGARIEGSIEKPFKELCESLLNEKKVLMPKLENLSFNKQNEMAFKAYAKIIWCMKHCEDFNNKIFQIKNDCTQNIALCIEEENLMPFKEQINETAKLIIEFKEKIEMRNIFDLSEALQPLIIQFELNIAKACTIVPKDENELLHKNLFWIKEHILWFDLISSHIKAQQDILKIKVKPLEELLCERKFEKRLIKIKEKMKKTNTMGGGYRVIPSWIKMILGGGYHILPSWTKMIMGR